MPRIEYDLAYADALPDTLLDVYRPDQEAPPSGYPAVFVIHGGGWRVGDKSDLRQVQIAELLATHGYLVFNLNYTLAPQDADRDKYTAQAFEQCVQALRWATARADTYQCDVNRLAAIGGSAGANMSLMLGFTLGTSSYSEEFAGLPTIKAVVNLYGPVTRPKDLRVLDYLHAAGPAVLSIHGDADKIVAVEESYRLDEALKDLGIAHELIIVKDAPHTFNLISQWGDFSAQALSFLASHLNK